MSPIDQFEVNIQRARALMGLHSALGAYVTSALDTSDILRAAVVMSVSGLDQFIHEVVRQGMIGVLNGRRPPTNAFLRFPVTMKSTQAALSDATNQNWLDAEIRAQHGWVSFQQPDKIADAVRLISDVPLWSAVAATLGLDPERTKRKLALIVDRRNKIAHEADMNPTFPGTRWPILESDVLPSIDFIEDVAKAIDALVGL